MGSKLELSEKNVGSKSTAESTNPDITIPSDEREAIESVDREQIFEILSNERRRLVIRYLRRHREAGIIGFRDLVDQVTAWECNKSREELCSGDRKRVYTALRQTHLPKLDRSGVIEFDRQRGVLRPTEHVEEVLLYMEFVPERERFWNRLYLLSAGVGGLCILLIWAGIVPFWNIPQIAVAAGIVTVFSVLSLTQMYQHRRKIRSDELKWN